MTKTDPEKSEKQSAGRLPGDGTPDQVVEQMVRVDHAGEYGAVRIYQGQLAVLGQSKSSAVIRHMLDQEENHLKTFDKLVGGRQVRPTALLPLWHVAGFVLGAGTALLGEKAAMACTVAVEEAIDEHYSGQIETLQKLKTEPELQKTFADFREEELQHRQTGLDHGAEKAPGYEVLSATIKSGSKLAIWLSTRI